MPWFKPCKPNDPIPNSYLIFVKIKPKASESKIVGISECGSYLEIAIKALPAEGLANNELVNFVAKKLKITKRQVTIQRGSKSRYKEILIDEISSSELQGLQTDDKSKQR